MEKITLSSQADYGNWVPEKLLKGLVVADGTLAGAGLVSSEVLKKDKLGKALIAGGLLSCGYTVYMQACHDAFDFRKGGLMGDIHQVLVDHLDWDGEGKLLDVGCGAGALTIRCAKAFPDAQLTGVDTWGKEWNFGREQCQRNAVIEKVDERVEFHKQDAAHLEYEDQSFDAVVSCLVYHEVRKVESKPDLIRESLRVLKKGGSFALIDLFGQERLYGNMHDIIRELEMSCFEEVHYIPNLGNYEHLVPKYIQTPWMLGGCGLLYGKK